VKQLNVSSRYTCIIFEQPIWTVDFSGPHLRGERRGRKPRNHGKPPPSKPFIFLFLAAGRP